MKKKSEKQQELELVATLMGMMSTVPVDSELLQEHNRQISAVGMGVVRAYLTGNHDTILGLCQGLFMYGVTVGQKIGGENLGKAWETAVDDK